MLVLQIGDKVVVDGYYKHDCDNCAMFDDTATQEVRVSKYMKCDRRSELPDTFQAVQAGKRLHGEYYMIYEASDEQTA